MAIVADTRNWHEMLKEHKAFVDGLRRGQLEAEVQNAHGPIRNIHELSDDALRSLVAVKKRGYGPFPPP